MSPVKIPARIVFARIGRMKYYSGSIPGDKRPVDGGSYNQEDIGSEVFNFKPHNDELYGYFETGGKSHGLNLSRLDPFAKNADRLTDVLVVFVARLPEGGQAIVGWYDSATVLAKPSPRPDRRKEDDYNYLCRTRVESAVLLPQDMRRYTIPRGTGAIGQSNVCYNLESDGSPKKARWLKPAVEYVRAYRGKNLLSNELADLEAEVEDGFEYSRSRAQGREVADPVQRRKLEDYGVRWAREYFEREGYLVEDVGSTCSYDLHCEKAEETLLVEVKATTTTGEAVILTRNEAELPGRRALFVVHSVRFKNDEPTGGESRVILPWTVESNRLKAISYMYTLPDA